MERRPRRYVPGSQGLEGRRLLSTVAVAAPPASAPIAAEIASASPAAEAGDRLASAEQRQRPADRPLTPAQEQARQQLIDGRLQRIDRLPAFLQRLDFGRQLPTEAIAVIQQELRGYVAALRPPHEGVAKGFVDLLRDAISQASVKPETVLALNAGTERLLLSAGAPEQSVSRLTDAMTELARTASSSKQPVVVLTNDYALVLQTALGVGRPISRRDLMSTPLSLNPNSIATQSGGVGTTSAFGSQGLGAQGF
ncbi:hypothetical protein [Tautonia sociabilis]|uniref:Uncharacterized protein n=1 Tax=Tautonia sociabilis TaxID=2080755 RepID=A0A432MMR9_9BACT|nr:hypothetical protein [Tautonia sociabilis]RUL88539.1 hypothetical protein TsocGM_06350 [Tautonia sociabilis]